MNVLFFNVGESETLASPIAKYAMYEIDRDATRKIIEGREWGFDFEDVFADKEVRVRDGKIFYRGQFVCNEEDFARRYLTTAGRQDVIRRASDVCDGLKGQDQDSIYICLPPEMNYEEVVSIIYNICWDNGQMINEDHIIHDERLFGIEDMQMRDKQDSSDKALQKDQKEAVGKFVDDIIKKLDGEPVETLILCGDDSLYKALETVLAAKEKASSEVAPQRV
jgi:hypothetical protein